MSVGADFSGLDRRELGGPEGFAGERERPRDFVEPHSGERGEENAEGVRDGEL